MTAECLLCHRALEQQFNLVTLLLPVEIKQPVCCERCFEKFQPIESSLACPKCGRQMDSVRTCSDCEKWAAHSDLDFTNYAMFAYNAAMQSFMQQYKFMGDYQLANVFVHHVQKIIKHKSYDLVIPIPVDETTLLYRGFNQVTGFMPDIPTTSILKFKSNLEKVRQSSKNRAERLKSPQPFELINPSMVNNQRVLLIDDVYTTGRTIRHAAQLIQDAGALEVRGFTLAR